MAQVELNIVALGDFSSVNAQIKSLQEQVLLLQKNMAGVGVSSNFAKELASVNAAFRQTMLSTGQFTAATVKMTSETEKFGQALVTGKLKLTDYYNIIKQKNSEAVTQMKALAVEQTKLQNSIVMNDPSKQGILSVYTPTQINKVANATKIATHEANLYAIAVQKGSEQLITWGKNTQWAGRQLTVGMSVPLMIFGQQATKVFTDVNNELVRLQKVYGTGLVQPSKQALDAIKSQVTGLARELASTMGVAAKDTAAMAADLAATGKTGNDLLVATREAMRLSKLGELDTQAAMKATVSLQNVYKLSTQQLSGAIDFLNAVENQTSTSLQDLVDGIPRVGPIVQQLGGSFKDTAVMMVAMKEAGVPAAQSANAIKSAIASLINPTVGAQKAFAAFHINLKDIATSTGGNPIKMIMELQTALKGLQPLAQAQLIEKLFGKFQEARIQALIANLGANNSQTKTAFDLMNANSQQLAAVAAGEMKTATESVTGKYQRSLQTFKANLIPVGQELVKIATKLLDFGNSVGKVFSGLPGPLKSIMGAIAIGIALAGPIIMLTGLFANFAGYVLKGFFNLKQLATGGKTLGQLLTPELIAAENASRLFQSGIAGDVEAVNLLSKAIKDLTLSIESMVGSISTGTGIGRVLQNVATTARTAEQMPLPGFATGKMPSGIVPGTGSGKVDTFPAMLAPGELVVDTETTRKYWPLLSRIVTGKVPGYHEGNYYDTKGNLQALGPHSHTSSSQIDKRSKERITEQSGNAVYVGPQAGNEGSGSIPSVLSGLAGYISRISGLGNKLEQEVTPAVNALAKELEFDPMSANSQRAQISMMHFSPKRTVLPGDDPSKGTRKVWDFPDMAAGSQGDNQLSVYFDATKTTGKKIRPYLMGQAEKARAAMIAEITDPKTGILNENDRKEALKAIEEGFATVTSGGAAITKEAVDLTHRVTDLVVQDIKNKSDNLPEQIVAPEKLDKKGNIKSKRQLTGAGYDILWANETTRRQLSGELPAPSDLTADKWMQEADVSSHPTPAALKGRKELPFVPLMGANANVAETGGQYNFSQLTPEQVAVHQKALDQFIAIEVKAGRTGTQEFKALQDAYKNAMQEFDTQAKTIESEIESIQQRILSEGPNMAAKQLDKLKIQLEEQQNALASIGQVMSNGFATGILGGIPEVEASARRLAQSAIISVARTQKSASKSKVTEQLGFDFGDGYDYGILSTVPQTIIAGETLGKSGIQGLEEGIGASGGSTMLGRITSKIPFMGKMMPKLGNMMNFGLGTAFMIGGQMLASSLPKNSNAAGLASAAATGAGMAAFIPGVGPVGGAAIGLAIAGIKDLIKAGKEQEAQSKATWQSSTAAATFYNRATVDTVNHLKDIKYEETGLFKPVADLANQYKQVNVQLDKFIAMVKSLPSNDPLSLLIKNIKETSDSNAAGKLAQNFVNIQTAIGQIDSAKAKDLVNLILTAGEKGALVGSVNVAKSQIDAVISTLNASSTAGTFGTVLQQITAAAQNTTSLTTFKNIISGIQQSSANSSAGIDAYRISLTKLSDQTLVTKLAAMGYKLADIIKIMTLFQSGAIVNVAGGPAKTIEAINKQIDAQFAKINAATAPLKAQQTATQGQLDNTNNQITALEKKKAIIDKELKTQRDIATEMQRQHDYTVSQIDLQNKQKDAFIHGDYLSAATIGQQKDYATMQFNQQTKAVGLQGQSDLLAQKIADLQASASSLSSSITTLGNKIQTLADTIAKTPVKTGGDVIGVDSGNLGIHAVYPKPNEPGYNPAGMPIYEDKYGNIVDPNTAATIPVNAPKGIDSKGTHNPVEEKGVHKAYSGVPTDLKGGPYPYKDKATGLTYLSNGLVLDKNNKIISQWYRAPEGDNSGSTVVAFADGGHIRGAGTATSDSIPAYLSNGEYVVKADAVSHYGTSFFDSVNAKKFKDGGPTTPNKSLVQKAWDYMIFPQILALDRLNATAAQSDPIASTNKKQYKAWEIAAKNGKGMSVFWQEFLQTLFDTSMLLTPSSGVMRSFVENFGAAKGITGLGSLLPKGSLPFLGSTSSKIATNAATAAIIGAAKPFVESKSNSLLSDLRPKIKITSSIDDLMKKTVKPGWVEYNGKKIPTYTGGPFGEKTIVYQGVGDDFSELLKRGKVDRVIPTSAKGLLEYIVSQKPKDKNLQAMLANFDVGHTAMGAPETQFLTKMLAVTNFAPKKLDLKGLVSQLPKEYLDKIKANNLDMGKDWPHKTVDQLPENVIEALQKMQLEKELQQQRIKELWYGLPKSELSTSQLGLTRQSDTQGLTTLISSMLGDKGATEQVNARLKMISPTLAKIVSAYKSNLTEKEPNNNFDLSQLPMIRSFDFGIKYDKYGNIASNAPGFEIFDNIFKPYNGLRGGDARVTEHWAPFDVVQNSVFHLNSGAWNTQKPVAVTSLENLIKSSDQPALESLIAVDSWRVPNWLKQNKVLRKNTSIIQPYTTKEAYVNALKERGLYKEGKPLSLFTENTNPNQKEVLMLLKKKYSNSDLNEIQKLFDEDKFLPKIKRIEKSDRNLWDMENDIVFQADEKYNNAHYTTDRLMQMYSNRLAQKQIGIDMPYKEVVGGSQGVGEPYLGYIRSQLGIANQGLHQGTPLANLETEGFSLKGSPYDFAKISNPFVTLLDGGVSTKKAALSALLMHTYFGKFSSDALRAGWSDTESKRIESLISGYVRHVTAYKYGETKIPPISEEKLTEEIQKIKEDYKNKLSTGGYVSSKIQTPKLPTYSLPSFAVGTDYVPHDMIAQIHKGERIVPASENSGTMVGHTFNINIDGARYTDPDKLAKIITDTVIAKLNVNSSKVNVTNRVGRN